jgi:hypothetical protein
MEMWHLLDNRVNVGAIQVTHMAELDKLTVITMAQFVVVGTLALANVRHVDQVARLCLDKCLALIVAKVIRAVPIQG